MIGGKVSNNMKEVAVVVPIYKKNLSPDDQISIQSFLKHLDGYDFHAVVPKHLVNAVEGLPVSFQYTPFPDRYFQNIDSYSRLLLSKEFYTAFIKYEQILIAQTDALVLSSDLQAWCEKGWDYIGAPWAKNFKTHSGIEFEGVGNGGFSLRNVASALRVLNAKVSPVADYSLDPKPRWWHWDRVKTVMLFINWFRRFLPIISLEKYLQQHYRGAEDIFWGRYAKQFDRSFKVATVHEALLFSFEADPAGSYEKTGGRLPFGCHAWARYDRDFWVKMGVVPEEGK